MFRIAVIFGGSGYIGTHLRKELVNGAHFDRVYVCDLKEPKGYEDWEDNGIMQFVTTDVRSSIDLNIEEYDKKTSWVFNLAAIHREPGHTYKEYFDTNIAGAENINDFLFRTEICNLFFTSSIAPYGRSENACDENSPLYPETAYGISKSLAEKIHQTWLAGNMEHRLIIVRPSVIFGPGDPGNVLRMIKSLKKGTFVLPDGGKFIKGYGYIYGLVESMRFTMYQKERLIIYNYAENPLVTLREMAEIAKEELAYTKRVLKLPVFVLVIVAHVIQWSGTLLRKKTDIHPVRVKKAGFPTNIIPGYLIGNGFDFKYDFRSALRHWKSVQPEDF